MMYHKLIRDDIKGGNYLNKMLKGSPTDYKKAQCYYYGDPIKFCIGFFDFMPMQTGYVADIAVAANGHKFSRMFIRSALAIFFENKYYSNNTRLQALVSPNNKQALRLAKIAGFTMEGRLRDVAKDGDRLLFSMLKREFVEKYGRNILKTESATSAS